eukprot:Lithocolla_globosa_v1_NODE_95_length_6502_cov_31.661238.p5 type:complete len:164 gc:universal NODE_95_length_6502_cov_31.661238:4134-4625(+)
MSPADLKKAALHVGTALAAIHAKTVIHRDITPNNIIVASGNYYLIDFGVAKVKGAHDFQPQTEFIGTRRWASARRQAKRTPNPSPLDDWESLCLTLVDVGIGFDKKSWPAFQSFNPTVLPSADAFPFLGEWYKRLCRLQKTKPLPDFDTAAELASSFLQDLEN